jgi:hypothetical protein
MTLIKTQSRIHWNSPYIRRHNRNSQEQRKKLPTIIAVVVVVQDTTQRVSMLPSNSYETLTALLAEEESATNWIYAPPSYLTIGHRGSHYCSWA